MTLFTQPIAQTTAPEIILETRNVTRRYPGVLALDNVNFRLYRNQVNVLIGENGAGKSTLMRILSGVESADEGDILLDGRPITLRSPRDASAHGISIVHQELRTLTNLSIRENIFAGRELLRSWLLVNAAEEDSRVGAALRQLNKPMAAATETSRLSLGCRQLVEIARALDQGSRILLLDEPTSALSAAESESLFRVINGLKQAGVTILYISHRLHELLHLGDRFTVLRSGRIAGEAPRAEVTRQWIVERMTGKTDLYHAEASGVKKTDAPVFEVKNLTLRASTASESAQAALHGIHFKLRRGEILGIYGLLGAGRTELLESLAGFRKITSGEIVLFGKPARIDGVRTAIRAGIVLLPEDRQRDGLFHELTIRENICIASAGSLLLSRAQESARVKQLASELHISARNFELPVTPLSGGNQQKVLLARCLMCSPAVLLLDEPTRGVDVGAKAEIYSTLRALAAQGLGILFTSSEIEETRALADRALVLCQGKISAEFTQVELSDEALFTAASPSVHSSVPPSSPMSIPGRPA